MIKRSLFAVILAALLTSLFQNTAWAHPAYKDSSPGKDATVSSAPGEVWVEFTEMIEQGDVSVYDPCGEQVDHGDDEKSLTNDRITTATHADRSGTYRVHWSVLGADGHATQGDFTFTSTGGASCPKSGTKEPPKPRDNTRQPKPPSSDASVDEASSDDTGQPTSTSRRRERTNRRSSDGDTKGQVKSRVETKTRALAQEAPEPASDKGIWDGIPMGDFFTGLAVAALIGAAGGRIYAGIIGPKR